MVTFNHYKKKEIRTFTIDCKIIAQSFYKIFSKELFPSRSLLQRSAYCNQIKQAVLVTNLAFTYSNK